MRKQMSATRQAKYSTNIYKV